MHSRLRVPAAASVVLALLLSACAAPEARRGPAERPAAQHLAAERARLQAAVEPPATPVLGAGSDDVWWWLDTPPSADAAAVVTGVRAGLHDGFDRVVVDLAGHGVPGWGTEVVETVADEGPGHAVELTGDQFLLLRLAGMAFPLDADPAHVDPFVLDVGGPAVAQVAVRFWYEDTLNVFLGLVGDAEPSVTVTFEENPRALVVDVAHAAD